MQPRGFILVGRTYGVSREQLRSFLAAASLVLAYHQWAPEHTVVVRLRKRLPDDHMGMYCKGKCNDTIVLRSTLNPEEMLTTVLHEWIHACRRFPEGMQEKCTTTLCARIKKDIARIAQVLVDGTYQRAAFLAHTKMSYRPKGDDHYDVAEDVPVGVKVRYLNKKRH